MLYNKFNKFFGTEIVLLVFGLVKKTVALPVLSPYPSPWFVPWFRIFLPHLFCTCIQFQHLIFTGIFRPYGATQGPILSPFVDSGIVQSGVSVTSIPQVIVLWRNSGVINVFSVTSRNFQTLDTILVNNSK